VCAAAVQSDWSSIFLVATGATLFRDCFAASDFVASVGSWEEPELGSDHSSTTGAAETVSDDAVGARGGVSISGCHSSLITFS
jgi:hypothetical protein